MAAKINRKNVLLDERVSEKAIKKSRKMKLPPLAKIHKWLAVLVFAQVFIWLGTGLFFNLMDHDKARGNQYRAKLLNKEIDVSRLIEPKQVLTQLEQDTNKAVNSIRLIQRVDTPYYLVNHQQGLYKHFVNQYSLVNAYSGEVKLVDDKMAKRIAKQSYNGDGAISQVNRLNPPIDDFLKEQNPVWQVNFDDEVNTSVYIEVGSGRLVGHSNDDKRFVDFFFMLHFMDYGLFGNNRTGGFNHGQSVLFAFLMLLFSITGAVWTVRLWRKGRYKI
ncbi:hypothetical protein [Litorilituus lipolyticus]|nr:hypothetical protein [Litorilituus lipolyticus]